MMLLNNYLNENLLIESNQKEIDNSVMQVNTVSDLLTESMILNCSMELDYLDEGFIDKLKNIGEVIWNALKKIFEKIIEGLKWIKSKTIDKIINFIKSKGKKDGPEKQAEAVKKQVTAEVKGITKVQSQPQTSTPIQINTPKEPQTISTNNIQNDGPTPISQIMSRDYDYNSNDDYFNSNNTNNNDYTYAHGLEDLKIQTELDAQEMAKADANYKVKCIDINAILNNDVFKRIDKTVLKILQDMRNIKSILVYGDNAENKQNKLMSRINENKSEAISTIFESSSNDMEQAKKDFYNLFTSRLNNGYKIVKYSEFANSKDILVKQITNQTKDYMDNLNELKNRISNYIGVLETIKKDTRKQIINMVEHGTVKSKKYLSNNYDYSKSDINKFRRQGGIHDDYADIDFDKYTPAKEIRQQIRQDNKNRLKSTEQRFSEIIASELAAMNVIIGALNYRISVESTIAKISNFVIDRN